jgi:hypothetical protein
MGDGDIQREENRRSELLVLVCLSDLVAMSARSHHQSNFIVFRERLPT